MHIKIKVQQIESAELRDNNGNYIRDADINAELYDLINSLEIDIDTFLAYKNMQRKNEGLKKLINVFDLKLLS